MNQREFQPGLVKRWNFVELTRASWKFRLQTPWRRRDAPRFWQNIPLRQTKRLAFLWLPLLELVSPQTPIKPPWFSLDFTHLFSSPSSFLSPMYYTFSSLWRLLFYFLYFTPSLKLRLWRRAMGHNKILTNQALLFSCTGVLSSLL